MTIRTPRIGEFKHISGVGEIVGLGRVRQPTGGAQEVECQVMLAVDMDRRSFDPDIDTTSEWVGCGQLDLLVPGTRWENGAYAGSGPTKAESGQFHKISDETLGLGDRVQPSGGRPFPTLGIADAPCFLLEAADAGGGVAKRRVILLPKMELIRCLFGVGNDVLLELFDGLHGGPAAPDRSPIDRGRSFIDTDGTAIIASNKDMTDDRALVVAAVLFDEAMRTLHRQVYQQLSVNPAWRDAQAVYVDMAWPWKGPIPMRVSGRWIRRTNGLRRFVVSHIDEITVPFDFERIEVRYPGSSRVTDISQPVAGGRMRLSNAMRPALATGRAASPSRHPLTVQTGTSGKIDATGIQVAHIDVGGRSRGTENIIGEQRRDDALFGTGGRHPGADPEIGSAVTRRGEMIEDNQPSRSMVEALRKTWTALEAACEQQGWNMVALPRHDPVGASSPYGGLDFEREPLVAKIRSDGIRLLVVDRGSPSGDEVSLGILIPRDGSTPDRVLANAARKASDAVGGRWRSPRCRSDVFDIVSVNRAQNLWGDAGAFRDAMIRRLETVLEKARR
ncbi:hypothetical protein AEB_P0033 [Altererythrobacter sp. B11]|uniref:hypothetical protein n=1 Tax=Altererythrobacter sp. B11 TaxID=2060312 RepID=UPI000DC721CC|nr:hypothetical protein [Altererythrobacter sp. B11]BBC70901.1 hypothetical protein AEB_P0033 [Altererythrobacter sp. B11]